MPLTGRMVAGLVGTFWLVVDGGSVATDKPAVLS